MKSIAWMLVLVGCSSTKREPEPEPAPTPVEVAAPADVARVDAPPADAARVDAPPADAARLDAPVDADAVDDAHAIVPRERVGAITRQTDRRTIDRMFARDAVTHATCNTGGEEEAPCSHVAIDGKPALVVIYDAQIRAERVLVQSSAFRTRDGLAVGAPMAELVRRNGGKPITFVGFATDFPGMVTQTNGGPLEVPGLTLALGCLAGSCPASDTVRSDGIAGTALTLGKIEVSLDDATVKGGVEVVLAALRRATAAGDWAKLRTLATKRGVATRVRAYRDAIAEAGGVECEVRTQERVACGWNGDGAYYEVTFARTADGWKADDVTMEAVE